ncbi:uncharacterized protein AMSG_12283 [Thecamonas trahens ATCC 50062]|uniref:PPIase cyclophilin-type domain-containing protein n=1 Tax=Thecamonas trahens ATCC 50062 TaxID=461836 RepID=A0A0L0DPU2_THETB|nr:hypothetical protein AMSG_12283 [Thecamonas trahens ATCC 50062]KNC54036.1 hypothetical protein AMSG_12283 [Thecamonas trahens ATCC 50062]|eukprot:XP_013754109.1 hypothetical protein AMSG_12283 [Thecamonas trahens ATCC 50062]
MVHAVAGKSQFAAVAKELTNKTLETEHEKEAYVSRVAFVAAVARHHVPAAYAGFWFDLLADANDRVHLRDAAVYAAMVGLKPAKALALIIPLFAPRGEDRLDAEDVARMLVVLAETRLRARFAPPGIAPTSLPADGLPGFFLRREVVENEIVPESEALLKAMGVDPTSSVSAKRLARKGVVTPTLDAYTRFFSALQTQLPKRVSHGHGGLLRGPGLDSMSVVNADDMGKADSYVVRRLADEDAPDGVKGSFVAVPLSASSRYKQSTQLHVSGNVADWRFHKLRMLGQQIAAKQENDVVLTVTSLLPVDYAAYLVNVKRELGGAAYVHPHGQPIAVLNSINYLGDLPAFELWAKSEYAVRDPRPYALHAALARAAYRKHLEASGHSHVYLDLQLDGPPSKAWIAAQADGGPSSATDDEAEDEAEAASGDGEIVRLVFELYDDVAPKSAANFRSLCASDVDGLSYIGSVIHRVVPGGWIQGGDISPGSPGSGGASVFGEPFEDENFALKHDKVGMLGYANDGPHTNASQFYITLQPMPAFDEQYVAFGRLVDGIEAVEAIVNLAAINQRPVRAVTVVAGGEFRVGAKPSKSRKK